jgi:hypothetical protein
MHFGSRIALVHGLRFDAAELFIVAINPSGEELPFTMRKRARRYLVNESIRRLMLGSLLAICVNLPTAQAEPLSPRVLALYPQSIGELVFVDLHQARGSPYFAQLKAQVLPQSFRDLEQVAATLGVDFSRNVDRLSWAYVNTTGNVLQSEIIGVAEGAFDPDALSKAIREHSLPVARYAGVWVFNAGTTEAGREFVFAFTQSSECVFGFREDVQAMVTRPAEGGPNVMNNDTMRHFVDEVNQDSSIWAVMNGDFTRLGLLQLLGDSIGMAGVDSLGTRVQAATVRMDLERGVAIKAAAHCMTSADALWFSTLLQGALVVERQLQNSKNPSTVRVLGLSQVHRQEDRVILDLNIPESDLTALIQTDGLELHF